MQSVLRNLHLAGVWSRMGVVRADGAAGEADGGKPWVSQVASCPTHILSAGKAEMEKGPNQDWDPQFI